MIGPMRAEDFVRRRELEWARLERLLRARGAGAPLKPADAIALAALYRRATADLARAQRDWPDEAVCRYLNSLVGRGHGAVYRRTGGALQGLVRFYAVTLPRTFRSLGPFVLASAILLFGSAAVTFSLVLLQPPVGAALAPPQVLDAVRHHHLWTNDLKGQGPIASAYIGTNNILVAVLAYALGILFTIPTLFVLVNNGVSVGGLFGLVTNNGLGPDLLDFVVGHGFLELSIIVAASGAGLRMGWALLQPGPYGRSYALSRAALEAATLLGLTPFLIVAAIIEGNLSPSGAPFVLKLGVGLLTGVVFWAYLLGAGRSGETAVRS